MKFLSKLEKYEWVLFYLLIAFNLSLLYKFGNFPTIDGPAHLNNARILKSLLWDNNYFLGNYFIINPTVEPNWTGHFLLAVLMLFFKSAVCEKILLTFYIVMLPVAYRNLMATISDGKVLMSYFIFPFTYSMLFFFGFYNFSIGLVLLFISLNYFLKKKQAVFHWKFFLYFSLLQLLCYFSHVVLFTVLWLCMLTFYTFDLISKFKEGEAHKQLFKQALKKAFFIICTAIIPLTLFVMYLIKHASIAKHAVYLDFRQLINWLITVRVNVMFVFEKEVFYSTWLFILIFCLVLAAAIYNINKSIWSGSKIQNGTKTKLPKIIQHQVWLIVTMIILILYFVLPDASVSGGLISVRFILFFYLFLLLWLSTRVSFKIIQWLGVGCIVYIQFSLHNHYTEIIRPLNKVIKECAQLAKQLPANSLVLPLDYSNNWLQAHYSNYLGADVPLVILENYECNVGYFPLIWNELKIQEITLGNLKTSDIENSNWRTNQYATQEKQADYIFILGENLPTNDSTFKKIGKSLNIYYSLVSKKTYCSLYKNKKLFSHAKAL